VIATCPDREILNRHLTESREFPADVTRHIEGCADCQQELETLTDSPLRAVGLSDQTPFNDDVEPILRRVMDDLIENGPGDGLAAVMGAGVGAMGYPFHLSRR
jgi:hypothetical protein